MLQCNNGGLTGENASTQVAQHNAKDLDSNPTYRENNKNFMTLEVEPPSANRGEIQHRLLIIQE